MVVRSRVEKDGFDYELGRFFATPDLLLQLEQDTRDRSVF